MPPRELRDFASPLLQAPLNRLFIPRPLLPYIPPQERDLEERTGSRISPITSHYMDALMATAKKAENEPTTPSPEVLKKRRMEEKKRAVESKISQELDNWKPKEYSGEAITTDPFKTIFVGGLSYSTDERLLRREFDRFGVVKKVVIVKDVKTGKPRGYAFIEFDRERDVRVALEDADGMRIDGRKIFVDVERGRTVDNWRPRRLGGGAGSKRLHPAKKPSKSQQTQNHSTSKRPRSHSREREREPRRRY